MFRLFSYWNTYLTEEIRAGKHLDKAQKTDFKTFFDKITFNQQNQWAILWVEQDVVYWGKVDQQKVDKSCFFRTNKQAIEQNFAALEVTKKQSLLQILEQYIGDFLDGIDGCISTIESMDYEKVRITTEAAFLITLVVQLSTQSTGLGAVPFLESASFALVVHSSNFDLIKIERV
ncbi:hypothetical protein [Aureispira anguillae]|nr:hypothetical protein [Aureispira anguillae]